MEWEKKWRAERDFGFDQGRAVVDFWAKNGGGGVENGDFFWIFSFDLCFWAKNGGFGGWDWTPGFWELG